MGKPIEMYTLSMSSYCTSIKLLKNVPQATWSWAFSSTQRPNSLEQTIVALGRDREGGSGAEWGDRGWGWDLSGFTLLPNYKDCRGPGRGERRRGGDGYVSGLSKESDCPELSVSKDEGDIIGIRASPEPGNKWRFKYQDAEFTKGVGGRESW